MKNPRSRAPNTISGHRPGQLGLVAMNTVKKESYNVPMVCKEAEVLGDIAAYISTYKITDMH